MIFGGNAYVDKTEPGSARVAVNKLKILQFGEKCLPTMQNAQNTYEGIYVYDMLMMWTSCS